MQLSWKLLVLVSHEVVVQLLAGAVVSSEGSQCGTGKDSLPNSFLRLFAGLGP